jgi:hypothetical protein
LKYSILSTLSILLTFSVTILSWGDNGHKTITLFAMRNLPSEIKMSDKMKSEIILHSVDPDYRKEMDKSEGSRHFIDLDYYKEFLDGKMITSLDSLKKIYGEQNVAKEGVLPWATEYTFYKLIEAFKAKDNGKIILYASDLAHYVGDSHQPLHATINYNGQLTSQKGIHFRYEIDMFDNNLKEIESKYEAKRPFYIQDLRAHIFDYIFEANDNIELILTADKFSADRSKSDSSPDYFRLLWFKTKYMTLAEINSAAWSLSSLIYTAWLDAGKPVLGE